MPTKFDIDRAMQRWQFNHIQPLTYDDLARLSGTSAAVLRRMNAGTWRSGDKLNFFAVCNALECEPGDLMLMQSGSEFRAVPDERTTTLTIPPASIFISTRRMDDMLNEPRIRDYLNQLAGVEAAFTERNVLANPGKYRFADCRVMLVIMGKFWATMHDASGNRALDNPQDNVRQAIGAALKHGMTVIPVLIDGAPMPGGDVLPENIRALARIQPVNINTSNFKRDMEQLIQRMKPAFDTPAK